MKALMQKRVQEPETYDEMFRHGGSAGVFNLPYWRSPYFPMFRAVARSLRKSGAKNVLEVGCGTGPLAHLIDERLKVQYVGFDFSPVAVEKAKARLGRADCFFTGDATKEQTYARVSYDAIICTEVLEHIEEDLLAISHWAPGTWCICTLPNYDSDTHVRHFRTAREVVDRYGALLEIKSIETRCKPMLNDLTVRNWLRAVRWNRYRWDRLKWLMGFSSFDENGGWFILTGIRRG
jgi:SAM-dependent methyltransferase